MIYILFQSWTVTTIIDAAIVLGDCINVLADSIPHRQMVCKFSEFRLIQSKYVHDQVFKSTGMHHAWCYLELYKAQQV